METVILSDLERPCQNWQNHFANHLIFMNTGRTVPWSGYASFWKHEFHEVNSNIKIKAWIFQFCIGLLLWWKSTLPRRKDSVSKGKKKKNKKSKIWILKIYLLNFSVSETILRSYKGCWINCTMLKKYYFVSLCSSTRQWLQYFLFYLKLTINNFKRKDTQAQAKWVNCHCSL